MSWISERQSILSKFQLVQIDRYKLRQVLKNFKGNRVHWMDWIDSFSWGYRNPPKIAALLLEDCLLHLINLSITSGRFANVWKPKLILPLHKKKSKDCISNYRPVCQTIQTGKLVEYVKKDQIVNHFIQQNLFHPNHHGGLVNHSTCTALLQLHDIWIKKPFLYR